jgi:hypothetical protein
VGGSDGDHDQGQTHLGSSTFSTLSVTSIVSMIVYQLATLLWTTPFTAAFALPSILFQSTEPGAHSHLFFSASVVVDVSTSTTAMKKKLFDLIPQRPFGAPATTTTTDPATTSRIENAILDLEQVAPLPPLSNSTEAVNTLNGGWQLVYSDASEITRIVQLPLGFCLGPVFQLINVTDGRFENQALIKHKLRLFSGHTRVMANFFLAPLGAVNRAGVVNNGSRANVKFQKVLFTLRRFLVIPTFGKVRKTAIPNGPSEREGVIPSIDVTYLDNDLRISRGGDGSLFVLVRADGKEGRKQPMPLLQIDANEVVVDDAAPTYDASVDILPSGSRDNSK